MSVTNHGLTQDSSNLVPSPVYHVRVGTDRQSMSRHRCETGWPFIHFPVDSPFCLRANEARGIMGGVIYLCPEYCIRWKQIDYICLMLFLLPRLLPRLHKSYWKNGVKLPVNSQTCHSSPCEQKQVTQGLLIDGLSERAGRDKPCGMRCGLASGQTREWPWKGKLRSTVSLQLFPCPHVWLAQKRLTGVFVWKSDSWFPH